MTKVTRSSFNKENKKFIYLQIKLKQKPNSEKYFDKEQNTQEKKPAHAIILWNTSKTNLKQNFSKATFQSRSSPEIIYWKNSKWMVEADEKWTTTRRESKDLQHQLINAQRQEITKTQSWKFSNLKGIFHFSSKNQIKEKRKYFI